PSNSPCILIRSQPPTSSLFPYTTLFRSTGRVHQPPPVHQTFQGPKFVVCSFVPRKLDYHPLSIPVPYNHSNIDSEEMLYYVNGKDRKSTRLNSSHVAISYAVF